MDGHRTQYGLKYLSRTVGLLSIFLGLRVFYVVLVLMKFVPITLRIVSSVTSTLILNDFWDILLRYRIDLCYLPRVCYMTRDCIKRNYS